LVFLVVNSNALNNGFLKYINYFSQCICGWWCAGVDSNYILHGACGAIKNDTKPNYKLQRKKVKVFEVRQMARGAAFLLPEGLQSTHFRS